MAGTLSIADLQELVKPQIPRFRRCIWPVWDEYQRQIPQALRLNFDVTTEANVLYDMMIANAKREFSAVSGIQIVEGTTFYISIDGLPHGIDGQAACRFKKLTEDGRSRNYPTDLARGIRRNDPKALELEIADATVVDIGYVFNGLRTEFGAVQAIRLLDERFILQIPRATSGRVVMPRSFSEAQTPKRFSITGRRQKRSVGKGPEPRDGVDE